MSVTNAIWAVTGMTIWVFFWWLSGTPIPTERGGTAVFFVLEMTLFGSAGFGFSKVRESHIASRRQH